LKLGIDFGTTNSAVAVLDQGEPRIVELFPGERVQRTVIHCSPEGDVQFGNAAFRAYLEWDLSGRFLRSIKAFLAHDVPPTTLGRDRYTFPELIAVYLRFLIERAEHVLDTKVEHVVVGRPVHFHDDPVRDHAATGRLQLALANAGVSCTMQLEPVAAAHLYERSLDRERLVLVGDFGGGTADFAVLRAGPELSRSADRREHILSTAGVAKAGDVLDATFMNAFLMPFFGQGASYKKRYTGEMIPFEHHIQTQIQRLYYLHYLRDHELERWLKYMEPRMDDWTVIRRLQRLIFDDLGYPMAWAIEKTKRAFSKAPSAVFEFNEFYASSLDIHLPVERAEFAEHSEPILSEYRGAIDLALQRAQLGPDDIDDVFLTGGTSQLPFIRDLFADAIGADKIRSGDSFTSVCEGLALSG
jgi:hypothetical chaperone protein